jgi:predicted amidohydrolase
MLGVRARENGIWIAAADKCGTERGAVHYVGRSMIVSPDGLVVTSAPAQSPAIVVADVERVRSRPVVVSLSTVQRRALRSTAPRPKTKASRIVRIGVLQGPMRRGRADAVAALRAQGADAIVDTSLRASAIVAALAGAAGLRVTVITGRHMLAPEPARAAALAGADLLAWAQPPRDPMMLEFARTRALENRVYVLMCSRTASDLAACIVDPDGAVATEALTGVPSGFIATVDTGRARDKCVVSGTDVFAGRIPRAFALFDGSNA